MTQTLTQQATEVRELKLAAETAKKAYDDASIAFKHAQQALFERMERDDEPDSFRHDGILYVKSETVFGQVQDESEFLAWAEEHAPELVAPKPRKRLVNETVREHLNQGKPLPPGLGFYTDQYVSQRANGSR